MAKMAKDFEALEKGPEINLRKDEIDFKRHVLGSYPFWGCPYEPGLGSANGYPDIQLMNDWTKELLPIELKVGQLKHGRVFPLEVRPAQTVWHNNFAQAGGRACLLTGIKLDRRWFGYAVPGVWSEHWRLGYPLSDCFVLDSANFMRHLQDLVSFFCVPEAHRPLPSH